MSDLNPNPQPAPEFRPAQDLREERREERRERLEERREARMNRRHGIFWPLFLIAAGAIFLLHNAGIITGFGWSFIISLWPVLLIVGGLDGLWRGEGIAGSLFWLGIGVVFLLANLGFLPVSVWSLLWRFWPILLVVIGLDIIIGRHPSVIGQIFSVILALALLGGLVWFTTTQPLLRGGAALSSETISEPLQSAKSAVVDVSMSAGQLNIASGADAANLVQGRVDLTSSNRTEKNLSMQGDVAYFTLKDQGPAVNVGDNHYVWDLKLNNSLPTAVKLNLGAGENIVDLTGLKISSVDINMGAGQTTVTLPKEGSFNGKLNGAVGELVLRVPRDLAIEIQVNRAITGLDVSSGFTRNGNLLTNGSNPTARLDLSIPVGSIRVEQVP